MLPRGQWVDSVWQFRDLTFLTPALPDGLSNNKNNKIRKGILMNFSFLHALEQVTN